MFHGNGHIVKPHSASVPKARISQTNATRSIAESGARVPGAGSAGGTGVTFGVSDMASSLRRRAQRVAAAEGRAQLRSVGPAPSAQSPLRAPVEPPTQRSRPSGIAGPRSGCCPVAAAESPCSAGWAAALGDLRRGAAGVAARRSRDARACRSPRRRRVRRRRAVRRSCRRCRVPLPSVGVPLPSVGVPRVAVGGAVAVAAGRRAVAVRRGAGVPVVAVAVAVGRRAVAVAVAGPVGRRAVACAPALDRPAVAAPRCRPGAAAGRPLPPASPSLRCRPVAIRPSDRRSRRPSLVPLPMSAPPAVPTSVTTGMSPGRARARRARGVRSERRR